MSATSAGAMTLGGLLTPSISEAVRRAGPFAVCTLALIADEAVNEGLDCVFRATPITNALAQSEAVVLDVYVDARHLGNWLYMLSVVDGIIVAGTMQRSHDAWIPADSSIILASVDTPDFEKLVVRQLHPLAVFFRHDYGA